MNRRGYLAAAGTAAAGLFGYAGVRVADVRPYDPELPSGSTPNERIVAAARHRYAADHRGLTTIRVARDSAGESDYRLGRFREHLEHSRRKRLFVYTTERTPPGPVPNPFSGLPGLLHWDGAIDDSLPTSSVLFLTDSEIVQNWDAPTPESPTATPDLGDDGRYRQFEVENSGMFGEHIRPHDAEWTTVSEDSDGVTYEITATDDYARVVPLPAGVDELDEDCWVRVTLDSKGQLSRIVDNRVLLTDPRQMADEDEWNSDHEWDGIPESPRTIGYRRVSEFDRYGTATAPRPTGNVETDPQMQLRSLVTDLTTY